MTSGIMYTGLQTIGDRQYLFDGAGKRQTGMQEINGEMVLFGEDRPVPAPALQVWSLRRVLLR